MTNVIRRLPDQMFFNAGMNGEALVSLVDEMMKFKREHAADKTDVYLSPAMEMLLCEARDISDSEGKQAFGFTHHLDKDMSGLSFRMTAVRQ